VAGERFALKTGDHMAGDDAYEVIHTPA